MLKGIIIRNGLVPNSSWSKRVTHWKESFNFNNISAEIFSVYPDNIYNDTKSIKSFILRKIYFNNYIKYLLSPFIVLLKLQKVNPDFILLANGGFWEFFPVPIYCKIKGIPLLVDMVDTIGRKYKSKKNLLDYLIISNKVLFDYLIVKNAFEVFVISELLEKEYRSRFPYKSINRSVPSTVDINKFEDNSRIDIKELNNEKYFVFLNDDFLKIFYAGTITRLNGIDFFLKCISEILKTSEIRVKLIFAIIQGDVLNLTKLARLYEIDDLLEIVPPVEQDQLPALLCKSDILFIPEQGHETANAGFPGKTSEYLMSATPVITTNFSDLGKYLKNNFNACISDIGDDQHYENNLLKLLRDVEFRKSIGKNGADTAILHFSHLDCAKPYINSIRVFNSKKSRK